MTNVTVYAPNSLICFLDVSGGTTRMLKSLDAGLTWSEVAMPRMDFWINSVTVDPTAREVVWLAGEEQLWRVDLSSNIVTDETLPGVGSYEKYLFATRNRNIRWLSANFIDSMMYIHGRLYQSSDAGITWTVVIDSMLVAIRSIEIDPVDESNIFLTATHLFQSTNGGKNWQDLGNPDTLLLRIEKMSVD